MPSGRLHDYEELERIGSGSYGICKKIRRKKDNKVLVWKELDYGQMSETEKQMLVSEVNLLRELKHPHIVRYYDRIIDRTNTTIYIVMEFCENGDLGALIKKHKREKRYTAEDLVWKLLYQLVLAVQECHRRKDGGHVLHRDLKPANVFLDANMNVKLGDFGLARVLSHDTSFAKTFVGTPYYMSPEQVNKRSYNEKSDIWSLGCLMYELCALSPPFTAMDQIRLEAKIKVGRFHPIPSHYSSSLSQLINSMLQVNDEMRPSIDELLRNPYLSRMQKENQVLSSAQQNAGDKEDRLRRWEKSLTEKERELERREKLVADRERTVSEREDKCNSLFHLI
ncbi:serine/threonine-protein kinase Nek2 isoform X2 [Nematostella vectensis]|uniref:serine/threonine-protein kinase Nek2 isoform X2 n=1 Tax=Nematostella vectensis TaxID=45351 RepID=UPI00138FB467|nr:serine/threonine-protein kinase Nek2 isoform X2 [Nematostella vectensis]